VESVDETQSFSIASVFHQNDAFPVRAARGTQLDIRFARAPVPVSLSETPVVRKNSVFDTVSLFWRWSKGRINSSGVYNQPLPMLLGLLFAPRVHLWCAKFRS